MIQHNKSTRSRCFINPQIRHQAIMGKMQSLLKRKQQTKTLLMTFYNYIIQCLNIYDVFFRKLTQDAERQMQGGQFTSIKCRQIRNYYKKMMQICHLYLDYNFNNLKQISDLSCIGLCKTQQKMNQKYQFFITAKIDYLRSEQSYTRSYHQLYKKCQIFKQKLNQLSKFSSPIKFYDQTEINSSLNQLEKGYYQCSSMQQNTRIQQSLLQQKQEWLKSILDEIADKCVGLVKESMEKIVRVCNIMVETNGSKIDNRRSNGEELFDDGVEEMNRYQQIYSKNHPNSNSFMQNFSDFFSQNKVIVDEDRCNDLLLIDERCKLVKQKQIKDINQVIKQRKNFIQSIKRHRQIFMSLDTKIKEAKKKTIASQHFQANLENYRREFEKCFGKNIFEIQELSILLVQNVNQALQQLSTLIKSKNIILFESILQTQQKQLERFEKNANEIMKEHHNLVKKINLQNVSQNPQKNKKYYLNVFEQFKILFREISNAREERDQSFDKMVSQFNSFLHTIPNSQQERLKKQYKRYEIFMKIVPAHEVMEIMKNDQTYDILFDNMRNTQDAARFHSPIPYTYYEQIRKVLVEKIQYQKDESSQIKLTKNQFCCYSPKRVKKINAKEYSCSINKNGNWISGKLFIYKKSVYFVGENRFFKKSVALYISFTEIKEQPTIQEKGNILIIITKMGPIHFQSDSINIILQDLKNQLNLENYPIEQNYTPRKGELKKKLSIYSVQSNNTKIIKMYEITLPKQTQGSIIDTTITQSNFQVAHRLLKRLQQLPIFFSDSFEVIRKDQGKKRINYLYQKEFFKFQLRQLWTLEHSISSSQEQQSKILLKFNWKVIPKNAQALTFLHNEKIIIQLKNDEVYIKIYESPRKAWEKFISKIFYNQVMQVNENLKEEIHRESHRKCKVQYFLNNVEEQIPKQRGKQMKIDIFDSVPQTTEKFFNIGNSVLIRDNSSKLLLS